MPAPSIDPDSDHLTRGEREVPRFIARGYTYREIAQVVTLDAACGLASSLPLLLDEPDDGPWRLRGHMDRSNPQAGIARSEVPALALFVGPHSYVSPSAYATKAETGKLAPTWNYVEVHVHGTLRLIDDPYDNSAAITDLTDFSGADRPESWRVTDPPDRYVDGLPRGTVGFDLTVERVAAKAKLGQNKSPADRMGVIRDLADGRRGGPEVARLMGSGLLD